MPSADKGGCGQLLDNQSQSLIYLGKFLAGVAELADALDLGSSAARRGGSIPLVRTRNIFTS